VSAPWDGDVGRCIKLKENLFGERILYAIGDDVTCVKIGERIKNRCGDETHSFLVGRGSLHCFSRKRRACPTEEKENPTSR